MVRYRCVPVFRYEVFQFEVFPFEVCRYEVFQFEVFQFRSFGERSFGWGRIAVSLRCCQASLRWPLFLVLRQYLWVNQGRSAE